MNMHHDPTGSRVHMFIGIKGATPHHFPKMHLNILGISPKDIQICTHYNTASSIFKVASTQYYYSSNTFISKQTKN